MPMRRMLPPLAVVALLRVALTSSLAAPLSESLVRYFAYGSNVNTRTFTGVRGIRPIESQRAGVK